MKSDTLIDYAVFQLSPRRSRCEVFVSSDGNTEKLASGLMKPFLTNLKIAEERVAPACQSVKLEVDRCKNGGVWFTKGTLERFVRFVSTPEVLELVNTFDAEMSQLEAARRIYSQGAGDQHSSLLDWGVSRTSAAADPTKQKLLRAIDLRFVAVRQELTVACARAAAADFNPDTVSELKIFADQFGAHRLSEACSKFVSLCDRRPDLINSSWKAGVDDRAIRSSYGSDMSIDDDDPTTPELPHAWSHHLLPNKHPTGGELDATQTHHLEQPKPSTCLQLEPSSATFPLRHCRESRVENDDGGRDSDVVVVEKEKKNDALDQAEFSQAPPPARRLSVQDRINLFENKQKETSGSGGKLFPGNPVELRRFSSVSSSAPAAVEKAVLRRWSGASDMCIELSNEKKDIESPLCTPSSSLVSGDKSDNRKGLNDTASSAKTEFKRVLGRGDRGLNDHADSMIRVGATSDREDVLGNACGINSGLKLTASSGKSKDTSEFNKLNSTVGTVERDDWKDQTQGETQSRSSLNMVEDSLKDQTPSQTCFRLFPGVREEQLASIDRRKFKGSFGSDEIGVKREQVASEAQIIGLKHQVSHQAPFGAFVKRVDDQSAAESCEAVQTDVPNRSEDRDQSVPQSRLKGPLKAAADSRQLEGGSGREAFTAQYKGADSSLLASQSRWRSLGEIEEIRSEYKPPSEKESDSSVTEAEDSGLHRMKFQKQVPAPGHMKKLQGRMNVKSSHYVNNMPPVSRNNLESKDAVGSISISSTEQVQKGRQLRGTQELNDELKMKANELEKLFAGYKLRVPGEQSNSARRSKHADTQTETTAVLLNIKVAPDVTSAPAQLADNNIVTAAAASSSNVTKINSGSQMKMEDKQGWSDVPNQNSSELVFSDDSRGIFYGQYMRKRDAKLREEWGSKRAEKEAKMKAMQDNLEKSEAELEAKFSGSARLDSVASAYRRAEKLRSFNIRSTMRREQPVTFMQTEDNEDLTELPKHQSYGQDKLSREKSLDGVSKSASNKKLLLNKSLSSSAPRTSAPPVPSSAVKVLNSATGRRRMQSENPLAQSVPNLSDLRKENTKPSSAASKTTPRPQMRNSACSKSTCEGMALVKEGKLRRPQSLKTSSANPAEFQDTSLNSDSVFFTPIKLDREQTDPTLHDKFFKNVESQTLLGKGNGVDPGIGLSVAKLKVSATLGNIDNEEESDELTFESEDSEDVLKDKMEESEILENEHQVMLNNGESRLSIESEKFMNSGSENSEIAPAAPSNFQPAGFVQDLPGESPMSWNSRIHNPFSNPNEASDIDAFVDSPVRNHALWHSHSCDQTETDATQMRRKWGSAHKPILAASSSHSQSRKDVTKGFKSLLKFGRKSRGTDSLVDWISATTSEGDDDTEDGRDPANRSSEDLRKSRMGFLQGHSDDGFNENELFSERDQAVHSSIPAPPVNFKLREDRSSGSSSKASRSFFSLSSFRSKGSDSRPR